MADVATLCPIWRMPCIKDKCIGYEVHTKQRFKDLKSDKYISINEFSFYLNLPKEKIEELIQREVTIIHECKQLGKIIQLENLIDHLIPFEM